MLPCATIFQWLILDIHGSRQNFYWQYFDHTLAIFLRQSSPNINFANYRECLRSIVEGHKCLCMNPRYMITTKVNYTRVMRRAFQFCGVNSQQTANCAAQEQLGNWDQEWVSCQFETGVLYFRYPILTMRTRWNYLVLITSRGCIMLASTNPEGV